MISVTNFRKNIFIIFQLMINTGTPIEVYHKGKAYEIICNEIDKPIKRTLHRRREIAKVLPITSTICQCGAVAFNEICTNKQCSGYVKVA